MIMWVSLHRIAVSVIAFYQLSASFLVCAVLIGQMSGNEMKMRQASNQIQLGHQDQFGYVTYSPLEMGLKREAVFPDRKEFYGTSMPMDINPTEAYPYWDESRTDNYPQVCVLWHFEYFEILEPWYFEVIVLTFDTKITEYLCSGWVFFLQTNFDFLTSHFCRNF